MRCFVREFFSSSFLFLVYTGILGCGFYHSQTEHASAEHPTGPARSYGVSYSGLTSQIYLSVPINEFLPLYRTC